VYGAATGEKLLAPRSCTILPVKINEEDQKNEDQAAEIARRGRMIARWRCRHGILALERERIKDWWRK